MKKRTPWIRVVFAALVLGLISLAAYLTHDANADLSHEANVDPTSTYAAPSPDEAPAIGPIDTSREQHVEAALSPLEGYLLDTSLRWMPPRFQKMNGETEGEVVARYTAIVMTVAGVATNENEKPLFLPPNPRSKTALYMLAQGFEESGFVPWVGDGRCNDPEWRSKRLSRAEVCDKGIAWGYAQMHVNDQGGVVLDASGGWHWGNVNHDHDAIVIHGDDMIRDPIAQWSVELHWMRTAPLVWGSRHRALKAMKKERRLHPFAASMP